MENPLYSIGDSDLTCIYDAAVLLASIVDSIGYDHDSEFGQVLLHLCNSAWGAMPDVLTIDFREE